MPEDQLDLMFDVKEQYWLDFSKLVGTTLAKVPFELRDDLLAMLQDSSSVYGSDYESHIREEK